MRLKARQPVRSASRIISVERDRTVIAQLVKFPPQFLVAGDVFAMSGKLQHVRANALKRHWLARHPGAR